MEVAEASGRIMGSVRDQEAVLLIICITERKKQGNLGKYLELSGIILTFAPSKHCRTLKVPSDAKKTSKSTIKAMKRAKESLSEGGGEAEYKWTLLSI